MGFDYSHFRHLEYSMTFQLNAKEIKRLEAFKKHQKKLYVDKDQSVTYSYTFTPVGIGTVVEVENNFTKFVADITDYDSW